MIEFKGISKSYRYGRKRILAVDDFTLNIEPAETFGLIGPNGAGKSTTLMLLLGFLKVDSGEISIDNKQHSHYLKNNYLGFLPEVVRDFPFLTVWEFMYLNAQLCGIITEEINETIQANLNLVGMLQHTNSRINTLSKGMLKRVHFAQLLLGEPEIIILDEPTTGIDPVSIQHFRRAISERRDKATIIISSHNLTELERTCDRIGVMVNGHLKELINLKDLMTENQFYLIKTESPVREEIAHKMSRHFDEQILNSDRFSITLRGMTANKLNEILSFLINEGILIKEARVEHKSLEAAFNEIIRTTT